MAFFLLACLLALNVSPEEGKADETAKTGSVVLPGGFKPSLKGPEAIFTGTARIDRLIPPLRDPFISGGYVTFEPGARTFWHSYPTERQEP